MNRYLKLMVAALVLVGLAASPYRPKTRELRTVDSAVLVVRILAAARYRVIPPELARDAGGVVIVPQMLRVGLLFGGRFGRGIALSRQPNGSWADPVFVTVSGGSVGGQFGVEATDLVLVFKTRQALERAIKGNFELAGDASVAIGPLGGEAEGAMTSEWGGSEVRCYPQSRGGLYAGLSLEGARLRVDAGGNQTFYGRIGPDEKTSVALLRLELRKLAMPVPVVPPRQPVIPKQPVRRDHK